MSLFLGKVITRRPQHSPFPDRVSDLIDWNSWSWNMEFISETFLPIDAQHILQLPIGSWETGDRIFWAFSKTGQFTVRSCYHKLLEGKSMNETGLPSNTNDTSQLWIWVWDSKVPPKVHTIGERVLRSFRRRRL